MQQKSNLKTNFLNRTDELYRDRERGTNIPRINSMPKKLFYFLIVYLKVHTCTQNRNSINPTINYCSSHQTLYCHFPMSSVLENDSLNFLDELLLPEFHMNNFIKQSIFIIPNF